MNLNHKLTDKFVNALGGAIITLGEEIFDDLGPAEVVDIPLMVEKLKKQTAYDAAVVIMQLAQYPDKHGRCNKLARVLAHRLRNWDEMVNYPDIKSLLYPM